MRERFQLSVLAVLVAAATLASFAGCWPFTEGADCATAFIGCPAIDSGPPSTCIPSQNGTPVADTCGVFVSSSTGSDTTGTGTKAAPYQTLAHALASAKGQPVYACGETFMVTQSVMVSTKVDVYGALDCAKGWAYDGTNKTQIQADATMTPIPLTLASGASGSSVHDFVITAADATAAGSSSIAVLDDHADLALENVDVAAGIGKDGSPGAAQMQVMTPMSAKGIAGTDDAMCNMTSNIPGGSGGTNTCNGTKTDGGSGGRGLPVVSGDPGIGGLPMMTPSNGGAGQTKSLACAAGQPGGPGAVGAAGTGARSIGDITTSGYQAPAALFGGSGSPAQGGGGGGAALACDLADMPPMYAGPSGGGGGAGGCGGMPGNPGTSGGSSIGILALGANLALTNVTIIARTGGAGGLGGDGQPGAAGGLGGQPGSGNACPGGKGGQGGAGGPGGGGAGGHSIGIAIKGGTAPDLSHATVTPGNAGMGSGGGDMDMTAMTKGDAGKACHVLDFTKQTCSTM